MNIKYQQQIFARLEPQGEFQGGRIVSTDLLTLDEAAKYASKHAKEEITPADFLRAAARGEITLRAIVHREAKLQKHDGGIYCNQGEPTENTIPARAIANLPLNACQQLANAGRASWRTLDGFEQIDGEVMRFTVATLIDGEPDIETVPTDCRVMGDAVHALADAFMPATSETPENAAPPVPAVTPAEKPKDAPAWYDIEQERGCRRMILENWKTIKSTCGPDAKASQILRQLRIIHGPQASLPTQKTIHNCRKALSDEKLIP